jgi:hypothetical protein
VQHCGGLEDNGRAYAAGYALGTHFSCVQVGDSASTNGASLVMASVMP